MSSDMERHHAYLLLRNRGAGYENKVKMLIPTLRKMPSDVCYTTAHVAQCRLCPGQVSAGVYSYLPLANRVIKSYSDMRQEFDKIGGCWDKSWLQPFSVLTFGVSLAVMKLTVRPVQIRNREKSDFILGPTHEETFIWLSVILLSLQAIATESIPNWPKYCDENVHEWDSTRKFYHERCL